MKRLLPLLLFIFLLTLPACDIGGEDNGSYTVELDARPQAAFGGSSSATLSSASTSTTDSLDPTIEAEGEGVTVVEAGKEITVTAGDTVRLKACIEGQCEGLPFRNNFGEWGGDLSGRTENPTTVTVNEDMTIFAVFRVAESYDIQYEFLSGDTLDSGEEQTLDVQASIQTYQGETKNPDVISVIQDAPDHADVAFEGVRDTSHTWVPEEAGKQCVSFSVNWGMGGYVTRDSFYVAPLTSENTKNCFY